MCIHVLYNIPPFNPGIFEGGKARNSGKYFTRPREISTPPRVFLASKRDRGGGGPPDVRL